MVGLLTLGLVWAAATIAAGVGTISYSRYTIGKISEHNEYVHGRELLGKANGEARIYNAIVEDLASKDMLLGGVVPKYVLDLKDWATEEISSLPTKDRVALTYGADVVKAGPLPGVSIRLSQSGKSYDYNHWQALCAYCKNREVGKKLKPIQKPVEVDTFDEPRQE